MNLRDRELDEGEQGSQSIPAAFGQAQSTPEFPKGEECLSHLFFKMFGDKHTADLLRKKIQCLTLHTTGTFLLSAEI